MQKIVGGDEMTNYEKAFEDYARGMKYKDIALKYGVALDTVKSWYKRYAWKDRKKALIGQIVQAAGTDEQKKAAAPGEETATDYELILNQNKMRDIIEKDLKQQLLENNRAKSYYLDLLNDYLAFWDIKNLLIADIKKRGVTVLGASAEKKNDSISELNKTNAQMLRVLSELGLKATDVEKVVVDDEL